MLTSFTHVDREDRSAEQMRITVMRAELASLIERHTGVDGRHATAVPGLSFGRASRVACPTFTVYQPAFCVLAQGSKRVLLHDEAYVYDAGHYLVVSQNLPVGVQQMDAALEAPMLGLTVDFAPKEVAAAALEMCGDAAGIRRGCERGLFTGDISPALMDAVLRFASLVDTPDDVATLAPLYSREILYRVLRGPEGWRLAQMALAESHSLRIAQAINWLHAHFQEPLVVEDLANLVHMSVSSLHLHFKAVTAMSPLQFQKRLRLQAARQIMLTERVDAGTAGHRVGYESQSQFNREYSRFFGAPPARDVKRLREEQLRGA